MTGSKCGTVKLQNEDNTASEYISIPMFENEVTAMCGAPENQAVVCSYQTLKLIGPELEVIKTFKGPNARTTSVDINGSLIGTGGEDKIVRIYQVVKDSLNDAAYKVREFKVLRH